MKLLITGFGAFGDSQDNPSALIARRLSPCAEVLEVTYQAADERIAQARAEGVTLWLMLGLKANSDCLNLELYGRNKVGTTPDVAGVVPTSREIAVGGPALLASTLFAVPDLMKPSRSWSLSSSAGDYLCNYLLYSALYSIPGIAAGFVHVPPLEHLDLDSQVRRLKRLIRVLGIWSG